MDLRRRYEDWVRGYQKAWESNDPDDVGALFSEDASYFTEPYEAPKVGREAIVADWIERKDAPGDWTFEFEILVATDEIGILKGTTRYETSGKTYENLWEIYLTDEGTARRFVEWWMLVPKS